MLVRSGFGALRSPSMAGKLKGGADFATGAAVFAVERDGDREWIRRRVFRRYTAAEAWRGKSFLGLQWMTKVMIRRHSCPGFGRRSGWILPEKGDQAGNGIFD